MSRDELVECAAIIDSVRRGELDHLEIPEQPLDILAQQIVASVAAEEWTEDSLFQMVRRVYPFRNLEREQFDSIVRMLAEGFTTKRGRRSTYLHHDAVNQRLRGRRGARLAAITSGGAIPDTADYAVVLEPSELVIGSVNEDFAIESLQGDIFQLGNTSWRVLRVEQGKVRVEDAHGQPPSIPFWLGEAPARSQELSESVARLREEVASRVISVSSEVMSNSDGEGEEKITSSVNLEPAINWLTNEVGIIRSGAEQIVEYLAGAKIVLGVIPSQQNLVLERFFDDSAAAACCALAFGSRINRAWGLACANVSVASSTSNFRQLQPKTRLFCRSDPLTVFRSTSLPLSELKTVRQLLCQALLDAPMWNIRWRWNVTRSLAVLRRRGARRFQLNCAWMLKIH